jgi:hypothetical protein
MTTFPLAVYGISLAVFPFLDVHGSPFSKVNNDMSSGMPVTGKYDSLKGWWQRRPQQSDKSAEK